MRRGSLLPVAGALALLAASAWAPRAAVGAQHPRVAAIDTPGDRGIAVAARRIPRGVSLRAEDMRGGAPDDEVPPARDPRQAQPGWVTRRVVQAGEPLREPAVAPPPLVRAGAPVRFEVVEDGFHLAFDGHAVAAASFGDTVAVRLGPKRRLIGVVAGPARVVALSPRRIP